MTTLTYSFPFFNGINPTSLVVMGLDDIIAVKRNLDFQLNQLDSDYNEQFCTTPEYVEAYREARKPLELSMAFVVAALHPHYVQAVEAKQARVERERRAAFKAQVRSFLAA